MSKIATKQKEINNKKIKDLMRKGGRKDARKDFLELLKRASKFSISN